MNSQRPVGEVGAARTRSDVRIDSNPRHVRWQRDGRATKIVSASHEQSFLEEYTVFTNINRLALPLVMLLVSGISACRTSPVTDTAPHGPEAEIRSILDQYFADFNDGRPEAIPGVWHLPGWVASGTRNLLLADEAAVRSFYKAVLDTIEAEGYDHSDLLTVDINLSNEACATVDFTFTR